MTPGAFCGWFWARFRVCSRFWDEIAAACAQASFLMLLWFLSCSCHPSHCYFLWPCFASPSEGDDSEPSWISSSPDSFEFPMTAVSGLESTGNVKAVSCKIFSVDWHMTEDSSSGQALSLVFFFWWGRVWLWSEFVLLKWKCFWESFDMSVSLPVMDLYEVPRVASCSWRTAVNRDSQCLFSLPWCLYVFTTHLCFHAQSGQMAAVAVKGQLSRHYSRAEECF